MEIKNNEFPAEYVPQWGKSREWLNLSAMVLLAALSAYLIYQFVQALQHALHMSPGVELLEAIAMTVGIAAGLLAFVAFGMVVGWQDLQRDAFTKLVRAHVFDGDGDIPSLAEEAVSQENGHAEPVEGRSDKTQYRFPEAEYEEKDGVYRRKLGLQVDVLKRGNGRRELDRIRADVTV